MEITERIARNIVSEISSTIHQAVNLMNAEGMIIASTNPKRVGTLHKGAEENEQESVEWELEEFEREIRRQSLSPMGTHI